MMTMQLQDCNRRKRKIEADNKHDPDRLLFDAACNMRADLKNYRYRKFVYVFLGRLMHAVSYRSMFHSAGGSCSGAVSNFERALIALRGRPNFIAATRRKYASPDGRVLNYSPQ